MDIKAEREKRGLTRGQVAELLGSSKRTVESWEDGRRNPSKQIIMLIENGALDKKTGE